MKKLLIAALLMAASPAFAETIHVGIEGMTCENCSKAVTTNFSSNAAVEKVEVDLEKSLATITTKKDKTLDDKAIKKIVADSGFKTTNIHHMK